MNALADTAVLRVENVSKHYPVAGGTLRAVQDVSLHVARGEAVGLVGESGSGKTTVGRLVVRLVRPTAGRIVLDDTDLTELSDSEFRPYRRRIQFIFQDPFASLDPRMRVGAIVAEGLDIHGIGKRSERRDRAADLLRQVGLDPDHAGRYPHEFSGGQRQRIGIARALAVAPDFIVADEPVSALDVSIRAQIINLLAELQGSMRLGLLFIAHDLAAVEALCDRVAVMYLGRIMEIAPVETLYSSPRHPYTEALLSAVPQIERDGTAPRIVLEGEIPTPTNPPSGCVFRTRCRYALPACAAEIPALRDHGDGHLAACIRDGLLA